MYCPNCAAPIDGVKFCRTCGTNVSLDSQAITGRLPQQPAPPPGLEHHINAVANPENNGIREIFIGVAFLLLSIIMTKWLLIPAFVLLGKGIGKLTSLRMAQRYLAELTRSQPPVSASASSGTLPATPDTGELPVHSGSYQPPASVIEGTTRHLAGTTGRSEQNI